MFNLNPFKFSHNPDKFRFKIKPSWVSDDCVCFKYSANGGITWKTIYQCSVDTDVMNGYYTWDHKIHTLGSGKFDYEKKQFLTYQKILDYEKEQWDELRRKNKHQSEHFKEHRSRRKQLLKTANE